MPRLRRLELAGFRSFGEPRTLTFEGPCAVISGPNSQGKTAVVEAIEFLLTGMTVRRELLGGAKAEFDRSLRNVHLPADSAVWVEAELEDDAGTPHVVRRELLADYTGQDECGSRLTVDGAAAASLSSLGIQLADPPLRAPVLLQHSLRFALSAKPSERTEYFKSVVEIADLELFRDAVSAARARVASPTSAVLDVVTRCAEVPELAAVSAELQTADPTAERIDALLRDALEVALSATGTTAADIPATLAERVLLLSTALERERDQRFSVAPFRSSSSVGPLALALDDGIVGRYLDVRATVDAETERLGRIFTAVLAVPAIGDTDSPIDCPICETADALTPARIQTMRNEVEADAAFTAARGAVSNHVTDVLRAVSNARLTVGEEVPASVAWGEADWTGIRDRVNAYRIPDATVDEVAMLAGRLSSAVITYETARTEAAQVLQSVEADLHTLTAETLTETSAALARVVAARHDVVSQGESLAAAVGPMIAAITGELDRIAGLTRWSDLLTLAASPQALRGALVESAAAMRVRAELDAAVTEIDHVKGALFDSRFAAISDEIEAWWELLRPEEHVSFGGVRRRGTGRRYVDFKASMRAQLDGDSVERDAIGVFSDSQLNALGLASFLARCEKQGVPFVVLDEPVQAGDAEHRTTFARFAVKRLMDNGVQVIVSSYDDHLTKLLRDLYRDAPIDSFAVSLSSRREGTEVTKTSSPVMAALAAARPFIRHDDEAIRREGAQKLRPAAERLAKEITLQGRRAAGDQCDIGEYDGKTLGELLPTVEPYLTDNEERGKWRAIKTILDPSHHDDTVPARTALMTAAGDLTRSVNDHGLA